MRLPTIRFIMLTVTSTCSCLNGAFGDEREMPSAAEQVCVITDERIVESSGLALSQRCADAVWMHNDSGDTARLFLVGLDGKTRGIFLLRDVPMPLDWEDMCGFTMGTQPWLMIGDVGDNSFSRCRVTPDEGVKRACRLLLIKEPSLNDGLEQDPVPVQTTILFEYDDGPHNCESIAVDTEREEILLVSKSKSTPLDCGLYRIPLTLKAGTTVATAQRIGSLNIYNATAMDISRDNRRMVIISYDSASIVDRSADEEWGDAIKRTSHLIDLPKQKGGESVCFGPRGDELYLSSEQVRQPLWRVHIPAFATVP